MPFFAIDEAANPQGLRVEDLVGGDDPRPEGAVRVEAFANHELAAVELEVAHAHVVGDAVAGNRRARLFAVGMAGAAANHEGQLGLVVELVGDLR